MTTTTTRYCRACAANREFAHTEGTVEARDRAHVMARGSARVEAWGSAHVEALNAAFAADRAEPRAQLRLAQRREDGRMATWLITVTRAVRRRDDGRLVVEAYESYNDPYLKRDQPESRPYVLTTEQEATLLQNATTYQRRFAVSEGSGLRRGKAHG